MKSNQEIRPYLTTRSLFPENQETPIQHTSSQLTSEPLFFRRNHFSYPDFLSNFYWLPINGSVKSSRTFSMQEMMSLPSKTTKAALECAGNKRAFFKPKVFGEQWEKGAISQGYWKGVPLRSLLIYTGLTNNAKEIVFEGHDFGKRTDSNEAVRFARSLPIEKALHPDTIVAYEHNGRPLPFKHGFPLRLIVPGWYAMASVKWLKQITVINNTFTGPYQTVDYVYYPERQNDDGKFPVTVMNVNSTIKKPLDMEVLDTGLHEIHGIAWTGNGRIRKVEISIDGGLQWQHCSLDKNAYEKYSWVTWSYQWNVSEKGEYTILSRATDSESRVQPETPFWNRKGYGYNAWDRVKVKVE